MMQSVQLQNLSCVHHKLDLLTPVDILVTRLLLNSIYSRHAIFLVQTSQSHGSIYPVSMNFANFGVIDRSPQSSFQFVKKHYSISGYIHIVIYAITSISLSLSLCLFLSYFSSYLIYSFLIVKRSKTICFFSHSLSNNCVLAHTTIHQNHWWCLHALSIQFFLFLLLLFCLSCRLNFSVLLCRYAHIKLIDVLYFIAIFFLFRCFIFIKCFMGRSFSLSFYLWSEKIILNDLVILMCIINIFYIG